MKNSIFKKISAKRALRKKISAEIDYRDCQNISKEIYNRIMGYSDESLGNTCKCIRSGGVRDSAAYRLLLSAVDTFNAIPYKFANGDNAVICESLHINAWMTGLNNVLHDAIEYGLLARTISGRNVKKLSMYRQLLSIYHDMDYVPYNILNHPGVRIVENSLLFRNMDTSCVQFVYLDDTYNLDNSPAIMTLVKLRKLCNEYAYPYESLDSTLAIIRGMFAEIRKDNFNKITMYGEMPTEWKL